VRARLGSMFQSLHVRNYRLFAIGQLIRLHGVWMQFIAQDWLVLKLTNNSAAALGVVTGLQFAPIVLLSLYGGKLADRYDKRHLMLAANCGFAVVALTLGVLVYTDTVTISVVLVSAFLMGIASAIETPVRQAFASELVPAGLLPNALGLSAATFNVSRVVGPAIAGVAIWALDLGPVFLIIGVLCLGPLFFLLRMNPADLYRDGVNTGQVASIRDGLRYILRREDLVLPMVMMFLIGTFGFNFQLTLAVLAKNVFHTEAQVFGLLTSALALGAVAGALLSSARRSRPSVYVMLGSGIVFGALETLVGFGNSFWMTAVLLVPAGFFMIYLAQAVNQRIQLGVDPAYRGRVMAVYVLVFFGTTPLGGPTIGFISEHLGPRVGVWGGGIISLLAAIGGLAWELRRSGSKIRVRIKPRLRFEVVEPSPAPALAGSPR
jgi:MFS family permease